MCEHLDRLDEIEKDSAKFTAEVKRILRTSSKIIIADNAPGAGKFLEMVIALENSRRNHIVTFQDSVELLRQLARDGADDFIILIMEEKFAGLQTQKYKQDIENEFGLRVVTYDRGNESTRAAIAAVLTVINRRRE